MKLCINCKHFHQIGSDSPICTAAPKTDPVFGRTEYYHCSVERAGHKTSDCGPSAQYFTPKLEAA